MSLANRHQALDELQRADRVDRIKKVGAGVGGTMLTVGGAVVDVAAKIAKK